MSWTFLLCNEEQLSWTDVKQREGQGHRAEACIMLQLRIGLMKVTGHLQITWGGEQGGGQGAQPDSSDNRCLHVLHAQDGSPPPHVVPPQPRKAVTIKRPVLLRRKQIRRKPVTESGLALGGLTREKLCGLGRWLQGSREDRHLYKLTVDVWRAGFVAAGLPFPPGDASMRGLSRQELVLSDPGFHKYTPVLSRMEEREEAEPKRQGSIWMTKNADTVLLKLTFHKGACGGGGECPASCPAAPPAA
ncbi:hypothetical protein CB1_000345014 [Camelus ferus]|nr:hypothetical protein CB1_000345014 [Camelus ferus]